MSDTPSAILLLRLQSTGSNTNLWGGYLNTALQMIEQAAKGTQSLAVTGDATITWTNYATANTGQCAVLRLTGTLTSAATLTLPAYQNSIKITNAAGATVTIKCSGGTGVAIPNNTIAYLFCDATDYYSAGPTTLPSYMSTLTNAGDIVVYSTLSTYVAAAIAAAALSNTGQVLNSLADTTSNYLSSKLDTGGTGELALSTENSGGNEKALFTFTRDEGQIALYDSMFSL